MRGKGACGPGEILISAYCARSTMRPLGTTEASCSNSKDEIAIACAKP
jgi:hypothetical protein